MLNLPEKLKPYRILIQNFTSLSILQIANYLFPLIVLPYVVRVLGPAKYGLINFAAAFIAYFNLISDYGFSLSGTKEISLIRDDKEKLSKTFSTIITIKLLLSIISFLIFILLIYFIPFFKNNWEVYVLSYGFVIGGVLFPSWFYQGMEQMKYITIIQVFIRSIVTVLIFILINEESDYLLLVLLNSTAQILIGVAGLIVAGIKFKIKFRLPSFEEIKIQLKSGWNIFQSMIAINIYTTSNTFILGLFASETIVGYYAAADKIRIAFQGIQSVLTQTVFPHINKLLVESYDKFITFNKNLLKFQTFVSVLISLTLFLFAEKIVLILLGQQFYESICVLKILAILPFLSSFTSIFAINMLIPLDQKNDFMKTFLAAGIIGLISALVLIPVYWQNGTAIAIVLAEGTAASLSFWYVKRKIKISD
ncbi:MAG: flippase [Ignavibacteria bacterium]|nr:MAG: flippase [Ignavibacteria bacterium]